MYNLRSLCFKFLKNTSLYFIYICVFKCVCVHIIVQQTQRPAEGIGSPGIRIIEDCVLQGEGWELNWGPLQEKQMLLTTESSLQTLIL